VSVRSILVFLISIRSIVVFLTYFVRSLLTGVHPFNCSVVELHFVSSLSAGIRPFNGTVIELCFVCYLLQGVRSIVYGLSDNTLCKHVELKVHFQMLHLVGFR